MPNPELVLIPAAILFGLYLYFLMIGGIAARFVPGDWSPAEGWFFIFLFLYLRRRRDDHR